MPDRLGLDRNFTIYDGPIARSSARGAVEDAGRLATTRFTPESIWRGKISKAKNQLLTPERYAQQATDFFSENRRIACVYAVLRERLCATSNAVDFDDLLLWIPALALTKNDPGAAG